MNVFGFKSGSKINDYQEDNFTIIETTIQPILESLQKSQRNDYFGDKLSTKPIEHLRIISLNINGLDLGKGEHSILQLCSNLQDKGADFLCLTETNTNWYRQYLVQIVSATLKFAWPKQNNPCVHRTPLSHGISTTNLGEPSPSH